MLSMSLHGLLVAFGDLLRSAGNPLSFALRWSTILEGNRDEFIIVHCDVIEQNPGKTESFTFISLTSESVYQGAVSVGNVASPFLIEGFFLF